MDSNRKNTNKMKKLKHIELFEEFKLRIEQKESEQPNFDYIDPELAAAELLTIHYTSDDR